MCLCSETAEYNEWLEDRRRQRALGNYNENERNGAKRNEDENAMSSDESNWKKIGEIKINIWEMKN